MRSFDFAGGGGRAGTACKEAPIPLPQTCTRRAAKALHCLVWRAIVAFSRSVRTDGPIEAEASSARLRGRCRNQSTSACDHRRFLWIDGAARSFSKQAVHRGRERSVEYSPTAPQPQRNLLDAAKLSVVLCLVLSHCIENRIDNRIVYRQRFASCAFSEHAHVNCNCTFSTRCPRWVHSGDGRLCQAYGPICQNQLTKSRLFRRRRLRR